MFRSLNARIRHWLGGDDPPDPDEAIVLLEAGSAMEAEVARAKLDAFGIPAFIRNTTTIAAYGNTPFGAWEVMVRHRDYVRAQSVLGAPDHTEEPERTKE